jgi:hypothetical protein
MTERIIKESEMTNQNLPNKDPRITKRNRKPSTATALDQVIRALTPLPESERARVLRAVTAFLEVTHTKSFGSVE